MGKVTFSLGQEKEAEFWAWLTEGHIISELLAPQPSGKANQRLRVVSTEEIKQLITDALDKGDKLLINKLLEIASQPQPLSSDLIRKSVRVGNGEYLKLLYVKLLEQTSFSEVIVHMLVPYAMDYLNSFRSQHEKELEDKSPRLNHLIALIESWQSMSPESRSRAVDMGIYDYEGMKEVSPDYPYKLDDIKATLSRFIFGELEKEFSGAIHYKRTEVYEEFKKEWSKELSEAPLSLMTLEASIDPGDTNRVVFTPKAYLTKRLTVEDQEKLFEKYGEDDVVSFVQRYTPGASGNEKEPYVGLRTEGGLRDITLYREVSLPACSAHVRDPIHFEVEDTPTKILLERIEKDSIQLRMLIEALCKRVDIDVASFFGKEFENIRELRENAYVAATWLARSETLTNFLKIATKLAKTTDDFSMIGMINSCRNRIIDDGIVQGFVWDLVDSSVKRRSVVSFYVSKDVWRFLPLAIKGKDWITIANNYLASRRK